MSNHDEDIGFMGRLGNRMGSLPGRLASAGKTLMGFEPSGLTKRQELTGINPRRQYWANALADLSNVAGGGRYQNMAGQGRTAQTQHMEQLKQQETVNKFREQQLMISMMNAKKKPDDRTTQMRNTEALGNKPGSTEYYTQLKALLKKGPLVTMGEKWQTKLNEDYPELYTNARNAQTDMDRLDAMDKLVASVGNFGKGKEFMTDLGSFLEQYELDDLKFAIDQAGEILGINFWSGDQDAAELFAAFANASVLGDLKKVGPPVSDKDIKFIQNLKASLTSTSSVEGQRALIKAQRKSAGIPLEVYDSIRSSNQEAFAHWRKIEPSKFDTFGIGEAEKTDDEILRGYGIGN